MSQRTPELADIIRQAIEDRLAEVHVCLPGRIASYDAATQKANVQPLIQRLQKTIDGELKETLPEIPAVPVVFPRAGGFKITMPVKAGNRCTLVFCERSIDTYQVGQGGITDPDNFQLHDLSDPVAFMGWYPDGEALSSTDPDDMVLGEEGGPVIHIGGDEVNLYAKAAADFVALAAKTDQRIGDLEQSMIQFVGTDFATHTHIEQTSLFPGPPIPTAPPLPTGTAPTPGSSVAAQKVKAT